MKRKIYYLLFVSTAIFSCSIFKRNSVKVLDYFPEINANYQKIKPSQEQIFLGRVLFYDPILSKNNEVSCATCHSPYNAFAHSDHALSHGIFDSIGNRNAPALFNLAWRDNFMWDGAIHHLEVQALAPISHPKEMGSNLEDILKKLKRTSYYPALFQKAFGDNNITSQRILQSLAWFQLQFISNQSRYDSMRRKQIVFNQQEEAGYKLFIKHCNVCHSEPLFTNMQFASNGLKVNAELQDSGRYRITKSTKDLFLFKIPSLRNLSYSYPYMHDGRFSYVRQVINYYANLDTGVTYLSEPLRKKMELTENEKVDLIAFLKTLDDKVFIQNRDLHFPQNLTKEINKTNVQH